MVQIYGFYYNNAGNQMTAELGNRLVDFFESRAILGLLVRRRRLELASQSRSPVASAFQALRRLCPLERRQLLDR